MKTEIEEVRTSQTDEFFGEITDEELLMGIVGGKGAGLVGWIESFSAETTQGVVFHPPPPMSCRLD
ncbi:MAG: hypothetical protein PHV34_19425 [Verrucomicrobiae bacterium]|nr:hypothetical protein [Verrucomicrobiae bacterium]